MQILNEGNISENALKILWLEQLPQNTRAVIVTRDEYFDTSAELADRNQRNIKNSDHTGTSITIKRNTTSNLPINGTSEKA
ncbi:hypothetical protein GWI33_014746 [Rhynchophorus ferrugineus]|uniref:Uncharacterized protein n=1 Tax=Rhynchophorus ferrugineus TaxID=354439 RepID=A0A834IEK3_RHYFE|nr:hypothetical protein GWI33_014746 [Rhynchophorus ferrugineus]